MINTNLVSNETKVPKIHALSISMFPESIYQEFTVHFLRQQSKQWLIPTLLWIQIFFSPDVNIRNKRNNKKNSDRSQININVWIYINIFH